LNQLQQELGYRYAIFNSRKFSIFSSITSFPLESTQLSNKISEMKLQEDGEMEEEGSSGIDIVELNK
jgi:hypothetical protein